MKSYEGITGVFKVLVRRMTAGCGEMWTPGAARRVVRSKVVRFRAR